MQTYFASAFDRLVSDQAVLRRDIGTPFTDNTGTLTREGIYLGGRMGSIEAQIRSRHENAGITLEATEFRSDVRHSTLWVLSNEKRLQGWRYRNIKRWIDVVGSLAMIAMFLAPGLLIAAWIACSSNGPVFYRETRIGRGGRPFRIWKFRSMAQDAEWQDVLKSGTAVHPSLHWRVHKYPGDPRITSVGRVLRRWSLDELPQLLNVLRGDMSLIGPRPVIAAEVPLYEDLQHYYLAAIPGLSGLWQVSGRSEVCFSARAKLDADYVRNWTLKRDLGILFRTIPAVLGRVGAR